LQLIDFSLFTNHFSRFQLSGGFSNQFPRFTQMLFRREHVADPDSHYRVFAQFCLREISAAGGIDSLNDFAVDSVTVVLVARDKPKANNTQADRRRELEASILLQPAGEQFREPDVLTKTRGDSFAAEAAENEPRL
jgi:hypothetical protein